MIAANRKESVCHVRTLFLYCDTLSLNSELRVPPGGKDGIRLNSQRKPVYKGSVQVGSDLDALLKPTKQFHIQIDATGYTPVAVVFCQATKEQQ